MTKFFSLIFAIVVMASLSQDNAAKAQALASDYNSYWPSTGMSFAFLETSIAPHCYDSRKLLLACVWMVDGLARARRPEASIATPDEVKNMPNTFLPLPDGKFGNLGLYQLVPLNLHASDREKWNRTKAMKDALVNFVKSASNGPDVRIDFVSFLKVLKVEALKGSLPKDEPAIAADGYNSYLKALYGPHTSALPRQAEEDGEKDMGGYEFKGVGMTLRKRNNKLIVEDTFGEGPATVAGIKANDQLLIINGVDVSSFNSEEAAKIISQAPLEVKVRVVRRNRQYEFTLTKRKIDVEWVRARLISDLGLNIGYLKVDTFGGTNVCDKVKEAMEKLLSAKSKPSGWVLDFRRNDGGYLEQAVCVASLFLGKKLITNEVDLTGKLLRTHIGQNDALTNLPIVTLISGFTMSAPELISLALRDYERSWFLGDRTFGKGSFSEKSDLSGELVLRKTGGWFYGPLGITSQLEGIKPDFYVDPFIGANEADKFSFRESDYVINYSPPKNAPSKPSSARTEALTKIKACVAQSRRAERVCAQQSDCDLQLLSAQELLSCAR